jgi:hypothetical protein
LLSDTHIPEAEKALPGEVMEAFRGVDLILHAGDIYIPSVLDELQQIAPVLAARGDDDYGAIEKDGRVKERHVITLDGQILWLIHERPYPYMFPSLQAKNSADKPDPDAPDVVVFGHAHSTFVGNSGGVLFVNPGSPTFLRYRRGLGTVGILSFDSGQAEAQILQL